MLPAWGMHRMGKQAAKIGEFDDLVASLKAAADQINMLWHIRITDLPAQDTSAVASLVWDVIASLRASTSAAKIVAGSKTLHHLLPDLVPPMDRQYTFRFFTGQKVITTSERSAFTEWFPHLCRIGRQSKTEIHTVLEREGFMATGPAKIIDNAIIGFMQTQPATAEPSQAR